MSIADAVRFAKDLATDKDLVEKVKAKASGLASLVELGKTHGYNFTLDEIKQVVQGAAKREMSDAELDIVAGGKGKASPPGSHGPAVTTTSGPAAAVVEAVINGPTTLSSVVAVVI